VHIARRFLFFGEMCRADGKYRTALCPLP
jgi:hypothetical protein